MKIHREGYRLTGLLALLLTAVNGLLKSLVPVLFPFTAVVSVALLGFVCFFFRHPRRIIAKPADHLIYAPADGRVVVVEEVEEQEFFSSPRLQVSIFMSLGDVHLNRVPVSGKVVYYRYHPGRYRVAWHPKSSLENERATMVIEGNAGPVLLRQIAGAVARRIRTYVRPGMEVRQGAELGFIRFGSRLDILLPLDARVEVEIGQRVKGNRTVVANLRPARLDHNPQLAEELLS